MEQTARASLTAAERRRHVIIDTTVRRLPEELPAR